MTPRHPRTPRRATGPAIARRHAVARACAALAAPLIVGWVGLAGPAQALDPSALPSQGQVVGSAATLTQQPGRLTVTQHTGRAVIDWGRFDIGSAARVDFVQPGRDAVAINRVVGGGPASLIQGQLHGNGHVFIVNPAGVIFGAGAEVQVGGLLATTLAQARDGGMRNRVAFDGSAVFGGPVPGAVVRNEGRITVAEGGSIVLLGPQVVNAGTLVAPGGEVSLAAGQTAGVLIGTEGATTLTLGGGAAGAAATNSGTIRADGGRVTLQALGTGATAGSVQQAGVVQAQAVSTRGGAVRLLAPAGQAQLSGRIDVGAAHGQAPGTVQMQAARVLVTADAAVRLDGAGHWSAEADRIDVGPGQGSGIAAPVLGASLQQGDVTLTATQGAVAVDAPVTWNSGRLALNAAQGIAVNAHLDATLDAATVGGGRLALAYGLAAPEAGNPADYRLADGVKIGLPAGESFSTRLGSDGAARDYTVITSLGSENVFDGRTLQGMHGRRDGWYALGADIDASATAGWNGGEGFVSIGGVNDPFTGRLAGLGHRISGLSIVRGYESTLHSFLIGLFSTIRGAQLRDLTMVGGQVRGTTTQIGALVGRDQGGSRIEGVSVLDTVVTGGGHGGIVGRKDGELSTYRRLYSRAELRGNGANNYTGTVGGVVQTALNLDLEDVRSDAIMPNAGTAGGIAANLTGRLVNAHSSSEVRAIATGGGLVGRATLSEFRDSSASGNVIAASGPNVGIGGLVGQLDGTAVGERLSASGNVTANGHVLKDIGGLVGRSSIALRDATASGHVSVNVTGLLTLEDQTSAIGGLVGRMTGPGTSSGLRATGDVTVNTVQLLEGVGGLIGIGTSALRDVRAEGAVTGRTTYTHTSMPGVGVGGLVGTQGAADITDASALGAVISHNVRHTGGLVGSTGGSLTRVSARGAVTHTGAGLQTGGLAGRLDNGVVDQARATGAVSSSGNEVGGLVGTAAGAGNGAKITASYATGAVSGLNVLGGLVGNGAVPLRRVFASGDVTSTSGGQLVGGLVGQQSSGASTEAIVEAYATGRVSGGSRVGGLVGQLSGRVVHSHATGAVSGSSQAGGLVGAVTGSSGATASYWNTETSGRTTSAAGTGLTSAQMASLASFAGWDIGTDPAGSSVWLLAPGQAAPTLRGLTPQAPRGAAGAGAAVLRWENLLPAGAGRGD